MASIRQIFMLKCIFPEGSEHAIGANNSLKFLAQRYAGKTKDFGAKISINPGDDQSK